MVEKELPIFDDIDNYNEMIEKVKNSTQNKKKIIDVANIMQLTFAKLLELDDL